jgi:hypothetical protein
MISLRPRNAPEHPRASTATVFCTTSPTGLDSRSKNNPATKSQNTHLELKIQFATEPSYLELLYLHYSAVFALEVLNPGWAFRSSRIFFNAATLELTKRRGRAPAAGVSPDDFDRGTSGASVVSAKDGNSDAGTASASGGSVRQIKEQEKH